MRHNRSGCQGMPNRPEFREAATNLRVQCETLDQPAALAAYLNPPDEKRWADQADSRPPRWLGGRLVPLACP